MGSNAHKVNSNKYSSFALAASASTPAVRIAASKVGVIHDITGTVDIDVEVSNDGTNWYVHPDATVINANGSVALDCPFSYIRATETAGSGGSAVIAFSW